MIALSPAALDLLQLVASCPIPSPRCDKRLRQELVRAGFVTVDRSEIATMDRREDGTLYESRSRVSVMVCITEEGKEYLKQEMTRIYRAKQENN
jgi:hypothetical protein